ncbi:hypothetical protein [Burkholderia glumae]|uniref:hypothetical protein n=1 Tax=Burkholderia glumae TaxID=337 RepID=UPI0005B844B8|nr:hypothetical protein [Burkholderia glumae]
MNEDRSPESLQIAALSAQVDVLELALAVVLRQQTPEQRKVFREHFNAAVQSRESVSRNMTNPITWSERLSPHARRLIDMLR